MAFLICQVRTERAPSAVHCLTSNEMLHAGMALQMVHRGQLQAFILPCPNLLDIVGAAGHHKDILLSDPLTLSSLCLCDPIAQPAPRSLVCFRYHLGCPLGGAQPKKGILGFSSTGIRPSLFLLSFARLFSTGFCGTSHSVGHSPQLAMVQGPN